MKRLGQIRLIRGDAQCAPVRARTKYGAQRAHSHAQRTETWGRDFAMNYIAFLQIDEQV